MPKTRCLGKIPKKIFPLAFQVNIKICFDNFAQAIEFFIKKRIRQQSLDTRFEAREKEGKPVSPKFITSIKQLTMDSLIAKLYLSPKTILTSKTLALLWRETNQNNLKAKISYYRPFAE